MTVIAWAGSLVTVKVTVSYRRISRAGIGPLRTLKRPGALILLGFPAFLVCYWTTIWWAVMDS
ncbi:hypothetical protein ACULLY_08250, partial [Xanthomonas arboricola pv. corylina]|uniref:hypothetical protein n=1 Tax=Xanthomonas arboricola TaxID=56448 RepID=UPI00404095D2